jgi:hypothetical protein
MIKTSQQAYEAGRQAAMLEKTSFDWTFHDMNRDVILGTTGITAFRFPHEPLAYIPPAVTLAGAALGTYLGDKNLGAFGISSVGALAGGQLTANLGLAASRGLEALSRGKFRDITVDHAVAASTLLGQLAGGAATGYYTREKRASSTRPKTAELRRIKGFLRSDADQYDLNTKEGVRDYIAARDADLRRSTLINTLIGTGVGAGVAGLVGGSTRAMLGLGALAGTGTYGANRYLDKVLSNIDNTYQRINPRLLR